MRSLMAIIVLLPGLLLTSHSAFAGPMQEFQFDDPAQEKVFKRLSHEIRCLVCQNQAIGDSNADLARDLRTEIYNMLQQGKTEQEIVDFLVERYGDFVLYNPPVKPETWLLWFGPLIAFAVAVFYAYRFVRSHKPAAKQAAIDNDELQRLQRLQAEAGQQDTDRTEGGKPGQEQQ